MSVFFFCVHRDDDRSLYLVQTTSAFEELHSESFENFVLEENKWNFWLSHRQTCNRTFIVPVSYRLLPYLTLAFSHQAYLSHAWHIARHACLRYVILLGKQPNNKCLCSYRISCFSVDILIFVLSNFMISFQVRLYNYNGSPRVLSFTSFPLHVGIVSFSCCSVPLWYTGSLHPW